MIDFDSCETQFNLARVWANTNNPLRVRAYEAQPLFNPNYTLIDEELAPSEASHSQFFSSILVVPILLWVSY
jgi:hypothetical protein